MIVPDAGADDVHPESPQFVKIQINRLSIRIDAACGKGGNDLRHSQRVPVICLFRQDFGKIQKFQFLIGSFSHL